MNIKKLLIFIACAAGLVFIQASASQNGEKKREAENSVERKHSAENPAKSQNKAENSRPTPSPDSEIRGLGLFSPIALSVSSSGLKKSPTTLQLARFRPVTPSNPKASPTPTNPSLSRSNSIHSHPSMRDNRMIPPTTPSPVSRETPKPVLVLPRTITPLIRTTSKDSVTFKYPEKIKKSANQKRRKSCPAIANPYTFAKIASKKHIQKSDLADRKSNHENKAIKENSLSLEELQTLANHISFSLLVQPKDKDDKEAWEKNCHKLFLKFGIMLNTWNLYPNDVIQNNKRFFKKFLQKISQMPIDLSCRVTLRDNKNKILTIVGTLNKTINQKIMLNLRMRPAQGLSSHEWLLLVHRMCDIPGLAQALIFNKTLPVLLKKEIMNYVPYLPETIAEIIADYAGKHSRFELRNLTEILAEATNKIENRDVIQNCIIEQ